MAGTRWWHDAQAAGYPRVPWHINLTRHVGSRSDDLLGLHGTKGRQGEDLSAAGSNASSAESPTVSDLPIACRPRHPFVPVLFRQEVLAAEATLGRWRAIVDLCD